MELPPKIVRVVDSSGAILIYQRFDDDMNLTFNPDEYAQAICDREEADFVADADLANLTGTRVPIDFTVTLTWDGITLREHNYSLIKKGTMQ
jgi:hypothetical protein